MNQLYAAYARGKEAKELAAILSKPLSEADKIFSRFADGLKPAIYIGKKRTAPSKKPNLGWELLSMLPRIELRRIRDEYLDKYLPEKREE